MSLERHQNVRPLIAATRDFSALKRAKDQRQRLQHQNQQQHVVPNIRNISASHLFNYASQISHKNLRRASSQPEITVPYGSGGNGRRTNLNEPLSSPTTHLPNDLEYNPNQHHHNTENGLERKASLDSTASSFDDEFSIYSYNSDISCHGDHDNQRTTSDTFDTMYEIIQRKLRKHLRREEIFSNREIQKVCQELRRRALVMELQDGWQSSLSDLEIASGMKKEVLEAIYLLRNAHKSDLFSSQESVEQNQNNNGSLVNNEGSNKRQRRLRSDNDESLRSPLRIHPKFSPLSRSADRIQNGIFDFEDKSNSGSRLFHNQRQSSSHRDPSAMMTPSYINCDAETSGDDSNYPTSNQNSRLLQKQYNHQKSRGLHSPMNDDNVPLLRHNIKDEPTFEESNPTYKAFAQIFEQPNNQQSQQYLPGGSTHHSLCKDETIIMEEPANHVNKASNLILLEQQNRQLTPSPRERGDDRIVSKVSQQQQQQQHDHTNIVTSSRSFNFKHSPSTSQSSSSQPITSKTKAVSMAVPRTLESRQLSQRPKVDSVIVPETESSTETEPSFESINIPKSKQRTEADALEELVESIIVSMTETVFESAPSPETDEDLVIVPQQQQQQQISYTESQPPTTLMSRAEREMSPRTSLLPEKVSQDGSCRSVTTPTTPTTPEGGNTTMFTTTTKHIRPNTLPLRGRVDSRASSNDGELTPTTTTNQSTPSSGRSTPSFRKKPKRPEIRLTDHNNHYHHNKQYKDYIEILRADSLQSLYSEQGDNGDESESGSGVEISEEMIAKAFLSSHMKHEISSSAAAEMRGKLTNFPAAEKENNTAKRISAANTVECIDRLAAKKHCLKQPQSAVSQFLLPLLEAENNGDDLLTEIFHLLSPVFKKVQGYEEKADQISTLEVKIAVLQEEKRQLSALLKSKREENNITTAKEKSQHHGKTRDIGVQKDYEIVTEISHAAIQTSPTATNSVKVGGSGPAFVDTTEKGVQRQVMTTETSCQQEQLALVTLSTSTERLVTTDSGTQPDKNIALSTMQSTSTSTERLVTTESGTNPDKNIALSTMQSNSTSTERLVTTDSGTQPDKNIALSTMQSNSTSTERLVTTDSGTQPDKNIALSTMQSISTSTERRITTESGTNPDNKPNSSVGCQKSSESASNTHHTTQTDVKSLHSASTMAGCPTLSFNDQGVGRDFELTFIEEAVQTTQNKLVTGSSQTVEKTSQSASTMVGCPTLSFNDQGVGRDFEVVFNEEGVQTASLELNTVSSQTLEKVLNNVSTMIGCPVKQLADTGVGHEICYSDKDAQTTCVVSSTTSSQTVPPPRSSAAVQVTPALGNDFSCGNGIAELKMVDRTVDCLLLCAPQCDASTLTEVRETREHGVQSSPDHVSVATGDGDINKVIWCDRCSALTTSDIGTGVYKSDDVPCCVDDKLCDCVKPAMVNKSAGDFSLTDTFCDRCDNLQTATVGVGDSQTMTLVWCDKCTNLRSHDACVGGDSDNIDGENMCDSCYNKPETHAVAVGDYDVTADPEKCDECEKRKRDSSYFNFDFNMGGAMGGGGGCSGCNGCQQQPIICHYCGNKVDLNDDSIDETLQAMRDSMQSLSGRASSGKQSNELKRSGARKNLNLDLHEDDRRAGAMYSSNSKELLTPITPMSGEENKAQQQQQQSDEDEEDDIEASHEDVVQACKMLHGHFSGEKPLKQTQMMKYMGVIQALWFKTVKRRRANASVVKSYLDLYQHSIPELLETIVNLTDEEGNTALHYAMTYKNLDVASILLDSGECCVDLVNQAGYSTLMLGALVGFERKNDKYIMQRLIRLADVNKESSETGETPLMLAISRGNANMVELLLDASCDINAVDDENSTALMCACEHGNASIVKMLLANPECDVTIEDNEGSTALSIAMDSRRKDLALLIYGSLNFDARGRIKLSPSKQSLLGLGRRSPSPVIGRR